MKNTYKAGVASPAILSSEDHDSRVLVHGDDFGQLGDEDAIAELNRILSTKYTVKLLAVIGMGDKIQECVFLNRIVRYIPACGASSPRMEIEADQRRRATLCRSWIGRPKCKGC